jgi:RNA polymerase sigma factor (TIGR02999 family)
MHEPSDRPDAHTSALSDPVLDQLFGRVYDELRRLAHQVRGGRAGETLNTTALVHEAWLKLANADALHLKDRAHFFAVAARAMRQVVVDAARKQLAEKRGGDATMDVTLDEAMYAGPLRPARLVALDDALARLGALDPRRARVVEHRIFAGLTADETSALLGVSRPTVERDWRAARAWLAAELGDDV